MQGKGDTCSRNPLAFLNRSLIKLRLLAPVASLNRCEGAGYTGWCAQRIGWHHYRPKCLKSWHFLILSILYIIWRVTSCRMQWIKLCWNSFILLKVIAQKTPADVGQWWITMPTNQGIVSPTAWKDFHHGGEALAACTRWHTPLWNHWIAHNYDLTTCGLLILCFCHKLHWVCLPLLSFSPALVAPLSILHSAALAI